MTLLKHLAGGAITNATTYAIYLFLLGFLEHRVAFFVAFAVGVALNLTLSRFLVFRWKVSTGTYGKMILVPLAHWGASAVCLELAVTHGVDERIAPILVTISIYPIVFLTSKRIFQRGRKGSPLP